jgi:sugar lactone lactonase YvrE
VGSSGGNEDGAALDSISGIDGGAVTHADANSSDVVDASPSGTRDTMEAPENTVPILKLVAGALGGKGMQDGIGSVARFYAPMGVASDGKGNLFVADQFNHTIRKIVLANGSGTTIAGSPGVVGYSDGTGTSASFSAPSGVAYDGVGNLFVADSDNHMIRAIEVSTGTVTTIAGYAKISGSSDGAGMSAQFYYPRGVACDGMGNLFVADAFNHTIRKIVIVTGEVTTLAGAAKAPGSADGNSGTARFNYPGALLCDGAGNLFVADTRNSTIRKIVISTGAVTTLAGTAGSAGSVDGTRSAARLNYPVGMTNDGLGNLFFADSYNHLVRKLVIATATVSTLAGSAGALGSTDGTGSAARFYYPDGVASDGAGNLYVGDSSNNEIRKVVITTGAVTTFAGATQHQGSTDGIGTDARFFSPLRVASDGAGNLFVADEVNTTIRKIIIATGDVTTFLGSPTNSGSNDGIGTAASFSYLMGIASDGAGNLYISDSSNCTIRKAVIATRAVTTFAGLAGSIGSADGTGTDARFHFPSDLVTDGSGNLFVADTINHTIRKIVIATGAVTTLAGSPGNPGANDGTGANALFNSPYGVASDGKGNLFVADTKNHTMRKIVVATGEVTTVVGVAGSPGFADGPGSSALLNFPYSVASDGAGGLFVGDLDKHKVRKFSIASQAVTTVVGSLGNLGVVLGPLPGGVNEPTGLVFVPTQGLFIIDRPENAILLAQF